MAKGSDRTYGMALTVALLLTLAVGMAPVAEALPYSAPWTPLAAPPTVQNDNGGGLTAPLSGPWTPLAAPNIDGGSVSTESAGPASGPDGNEIHSAPWTPLSVLDSNDPIVPTPGTAASLIHDDITSPAVLNVAPVTAAAVIPEPATVILLGIGILTLMIVGSRRAARLRR